jgi:hypothetical protein
VGEAIDDYAADLSHVREVHEVVGQLRRLLQAAAQAEEAGVAPLSEPLLSFNDPLPLRSPNDLLQSPPGR